MNQNKIATMLIDMAHFYSYELEERQLEMYVKVFDSFPVDVVLEAGLRYVQDMNNTKFPMPPHSIMKIYLPDPKAIALHTAPRIIQAVKKFGWPNAAAAEEFIGQDGWLIVQQRGGWSKFCEEMTVDKEGTFIAQARDAIESNIKLQRQGFDINQPVLDTSKKGELMELVSGLAKQKTLNGEVS